MAPTIESIHALATKAGACWPGLVVAQFILESDWGRRPSGTRNYFGLKGSGTLKTTTEYVNGKKIVIDDQFIDFESDEDCVNYLVERWYKDWRGHKGVNNAISAEAAAEMLVSEGYATDPTYAQKLKRVMSQNPVANYADLVAAAENYKGEPQQKKALQELQADLTPEQRRKFTDTWRSRPAGQVATTSVTPASAKFPLNVPYHYQRDSNSGHGERMCQSSSISMRIEQIDPTLTNGDDDYLKTVLRYGDTVSQSAHQKALSSLGLKHQFRQDGTEKLLCELLDKGIAVPIGILHKGGVSAPYGGGHWITLIGYDATHFMVHDPFGELDLVNGGYPKTGPTDGKGVRYSRKNLMKRWLIASQSDGWLWVITK